MQQNDIVDALAAWQGGPVDAVRRAELLAQLRTDDAFRKEFAEALWMLSMVRVVQSPEPRWLGLSEELGLLGDEKNVAGNTAELAILAEIRRKPYRLQVSRRWRTLAVVSVGLAALLMVFLFIGKGRDTEPERVAEAPLDDRRLAVLVGEAGAVWETNPLLAGGKWLRPGAHRLLSGRDTMVFSDGTRVRLQAPVDFRLVDTDTISCRRGALRVKMASGAAGFRVDVPFGMVTDDVTDEMTDEVTDFAVEVGLDEDTRVAVFEGQVEIAIQQQENDGIRLLSMVTGDAIRITADGTRQTADAIDLPPPDTALPPLELPEAYAERILAGKPRHYWRLNRMENGEIPDETGNGNPLVPVGTVAISADAGGRSSLRLTGDGGLESRLPWRLMREGAALEMWFVSEGKSQTSLAGLATKRADARHFALLGHNNEDASESYPGKQFPNSLRFLTRWPANVRGGVNLFSGPVYGPLTWHHVVIQIKDGRMELHADGMPMKIATGDAIPEAIDLFSTFGFAYTLGRGNLKKAIPDRFLTGRIAEIAVYDRVLSVDEIRERYGRMAEIAVIKKGTSPAAHSQKSRKSTE